MVARNPFCEPSSEDWKDDMDKNGLDTMLCSQASIDWQKRSPLLALASSSQAMPMPNKTCHVLLGWVCWAPKHGSCQPPGTGTPWFVALSMESMGDPVQACSLALVGLELARRCWTGQRLVHQPLKCPALESMPLKILALLGSDPGIRCPVVPVNRLSPPCAKEIVTYRRVSGASSSCS
ncbi:hypothetical protein CDV31_008435 [Fusarium ambrosium]|uniref:Uncharacterized protein n=1 Tax=Fusarium ambrosium TaxID=131363 RepID=A0A428U0P3_9HYPO|nr:hypothetical protein CDV31_008435 [Fusarium ambrosium]